MINEGAGRFQFGLVPGVPPFLGWACKEDITDIFLSSSLFSRSVSPSGVPVQSDLYPSAGNPWGAESRNGNSFPLVQFSSINSVPGATRVSSPSLYRWWAQGVPFFSAHVSLQPSNGARKDVNRRFFLLSPPLSWRISRVVGSLFAPLSFF